MLTRYEKDVLAFVLVAAFVAAAITNTKATTAWNKGVNAIVYHDTAKLPPLETHRFLPRVVLPVRLTAYYAETCATDPRRALTATGQNACNETGVAAAFSFLPPGTKLCIPGVGQRVVDDTGLDMLRAAARRCIHLDIRVRSRAAAILFGVRWVLAELRHS